jgi:hypothetical protein
MSRDHGPDPCERHSVEDLRAIYEVCMDLFQDAIVVAIGTTKIEPSELTASRTVAQYIASEAGKKALMTAAWLAGFNKSDIRPNKLTNGKVSYNLDVHMDAGYITRVVVNRDETWPSFHSGLLWDGQ